jgi:Trk K+ transport system NAD-binding subunit
LRVRESGIELADAFVAATDSDNSNAMAVQMAKRVFGVPKTITRLDHPAREDAYRALDVQFVPGAKLTSKVIYEQLVIEEFSFHVTFSGGDVEIVDMVIGSNGAGVTGLDEVNLVACQLALTMGARQVLARLNNPLNRPTFEALKVPVVAVTDFMATLISREVEAPESRHVTRLGRGEISAYEIDIPDHFDARPVAEVRLPSEPILTAVVSEDEVRVPTTTTQLRPGDQVTAVSSVDLEAVVRAALGHRDRRKK